MQAGGTAGERSSRSAIGDLRVSTFESVVAQFPQAGFIVDLKVDGTEEPLARLIAERELNRRVIVGSFSDERLASLPGVDREPRGYFHRDQRNDSGHRVEPQRQVEPFRRLHIGDAGPGLLVRLSDCEPPAR